MTKGGASDAIEAGSWGVVFYGFDRLDASCADFVEFFSGHHYPVLMTYTQHFMLQGSRFRPTLITQAARPMLHP